MYNCAILAHSQRAGRQSQPTISNTGKSSSPVARHHGGGQRERSPVATRAPPDAFPLSSKASASSTRSRRRYPLTTRLKLAGQYALRPAVRLKASLYLLTTVVVLIVLIALNAAHSPDVLVPADTIINYQPKVNSPADTGEGSYFAQGKDAAFALNDTGRGIQRSFEEPDFSLLSSRQPSEIGCDVPLAGEDAGSLVFLGIFSPITGGKGRRDLYRKHIIPEFPKHLVTTKFILGMPKLVQIEEDEEMRARILREAREEQEEHGDMVILNIVDNVDLGKTHEYYKYIAKTYAGEGRVKGRPRFVMKADDDTVLAMPNIISAFKDLDCSRNIYWGTTAGRSGYFKEYFRGLGYALSWPVVSWLGNADMPPAHTVRIEDARTGQWLYALDPTTDPVIRIDLGWMMGDWNQVEVSTATVALHWLKHDEWVLQQHQRILDAWAKEARPYDEHNGVSPAKSAMLGKIFPDQAKQEHERQKELGWDVAKNVNEQVKS